MSIAASQESLPPIRGVVPDPTLGFGEKMEGWSPQQATAEKVRQIAAIVLLGVVITTTAALLTTIISAPIAIFVSSASVLAIGAGSGAGAAFLGMAGFVIYSLYNGYFPAPDSRNLIPEEHTKNVPSLGKFNRHNSVYVTESAKETSEWKLDLIRSAKQSIEISGNFCGGPLFREALKAIKEKLTEIPEMQVHLITTFMLLDSEDNAALDDLLKNYPNRFHCLKTDEKFTITPFVHRKENHVKIVSVDEKYFVVGGTNLYDKMGAHEGISDTEFKPEDSFTDRFMAAGFRDMDVVGTGAHAKSVRQQFFKLWAVWEYKMGINKTSKLFNRYFPLDPTKEIADNPKWRENNLKKHVFKNVNMKVLISDAVKENAITSEYVRMINQAKKTIMLAHYAFCPGPEIFDAIKKALDRKVRITVITNGINESSPLSSQFYTRASEQFWGDLMEERENLFKVFKYNVKNINYHRKVMVVDSKETIIGSYNLSRKSEICGDEEMNFTFASKKIASHVLKSLRGDVSRSKLYTLADYRAESCFAKIFSWFQYNLITYFVG